MTTLRQAATALVLTFALAACGSATTTNEPSSAVATTGSTTPQGPDLLDAQLAKAMADLTPEQLVSLCEGFATDPVAVAEAFARPLDAAGLPPEDSRRAILAALEQKCST